MRPGDLAAVVRDLGHACDPARTDADLLTRFLAGRDDAAFAALVRRHGGMVLGVCRRVLANRQDAEDVFQVTFLVLARRAASVRPREQVGAWLHGVAYRTALGHRRSLARRRAKEVGLTDVPARAETADADLLAAIDREVASLPEKLRTPVVLCDLEGHSLRDAADRLGLPVATLGNRLRLARQRLAARLRQHGVTPETALGLTAPAVGAELIAAVCSAQAAQVPRRLLPFVPGAWKTMMLSSVVLAVLTGVGGVWLAPREASREPAPPPKVPDARRERAVKAAAEALVELRAAKAADDDPRWLLHRLLLDMAVLERQLGRGEESKKLFQEADEWITAIKGPNQGELRLLASALAKAGDKDAAVAVALRIPEKDQYRAISLQEAALELAKLRREKDALDVARRVKDEETNKYLPAMLLQAVAHAHARAGAVDEALRAVERIEMPAGKVTALAGVVIMNRSFREYPEEPGVALIQAEAGDVAGAKKTLAKAAEVLGTIEDKPHKSGALAGLACAWAKLGDIDRARKFAGEISQPEFQVLAQAAVARAAVKAGKAKEALAEAAKRTAADRVHVLLHIGQAQAAAKDAKGAVETFDAAHDLLGTLDADARSGEAHNLATARADAGDEAGAAKTTEAYLARDSLGRVNVVFAKMKAGDFAAAVAMAEKLDEMKWWQGSMLRGIAREQTRGKGEKAAREWVGKLDSAPKRANALFGIAEGLANAK